ncbi:MAG: 30S ribosomal protein S3 [archaeon]
MIERKFISQKIKEFAIKEYVRETLSRVGLSDVKLQRTPLGEKIIISSSRPGLVVGRSGSNISKLTKDLKQKFNLENPQIEIEEVLNLGLDANIIAEMIANSLEKFGLARFKGIGHKAMSDIMGAGALGVEILMSGKIPSSRAKTWRFYQGYLKKCGDIAVSQVKVAYSAANLKSGTVGIKVSIMTPDVKLPDRIVVKKRIVAPAEGAAPVEVTDPVVEDEIEEKIKEISKDDSAEQKEIAKKKEAKDKKAKEGKPRKKKDDGEVQSEAGSTADVKDSE